jgi:hypothetical protein
VSWNYIDARMEITRFFRTSSDSKGALRRKCTRLTNWRGIP